MSYPKWSGQRSTRLVAQTLASKGTTCHLCGLDGADSADHDPVRAALILDRVPNPDAPEYLWPAHRYPCNTQRAGLPITDALRAALRIRRLAYVAGDPVVPLSEDQPSSRAAVVDASRAAERSGAAADHDEERIANLSPRFQAQARRALAARRRRPGG